MVKNTDNFIMLPTVDFCFKELMKNVQPKEPEEVKAIQWNEK